MENEQKSNLPVFVKIDDYKDVLDVLSLIKSRIHEAKQKINEIDELKEKENRELDNWKFKLDDVNKKIDFIDKTLFQPQM